jgi:hypothetical protein
MAVVRAPVAVFVRGAAEFGHREHNDVFHAVAQVLVQCGKPLSQVAQ